MTPVKLSKRPRDWLARVVSRPRTSSEIWLARGLVGGVEIARFVVGLNGRR